MDDKKTYQQGCCMQKKRKYSETDRIFYNFFKYCKDTKISLLRGDIEFIKKTVFMVSSNKREVREILYRYAEHYRKGTYLEKDEIKKSNAGRKAANLYLLYLLDR